MTIPSYTAVNRKITDAVERMKRNAGDRDKAMERVRLVREGKFADVWPDQFSSEYPTALIANFVDVSARDLASNLAPLPSLSCAAGMMKTDADKRRSATKNRIGQSYWLHSDLEFQLKWGADQYLSYGFLPYRIEADYDHRCPYIHIDDPAGAYYELDRKMRTKTYARVWRQDRHELAAMWPEYEQLILRNDVYGNEAGDTQVVYYTDDHDVTLYLPERGNTVLASYPHGMPYCPVHIAIRPGLHLDPRGQFDDVLWVQLAASVMAALTMEAAHKAVEAPIAVPDDVQELNFGPDAVLQSANPDKIGRVSIQVPPAAFALGEQLKEEMKEGAGYPGTRLGQPGQANVTGRGIGALEGGFDSQIKLGQDVIGRGLRNATSMALEMDVRLWPDRSKRIDGTLSGESFSLSYVPSKDIGDTFRCDVSYGFGSGANPASAIVTMLQLRGDELITRDTVRRQLPFDIDAEHEQEGVDIQMIEDGMKQGMAAALQASGQMIAQGQAGAALQWFKVAARVAQGRREGKNIIDLYEAVWEQVQAEAQQAAEQQAEAAQAAGGQPGQPGSPDGLQGVGPNGLPQGVAEGQAGMPPGGMPSISQLTAGFTGSGAPAMGATIRRRVATG